MKKGKFLQNMSVNVFLWLFVMKSILLRDEIFRVYLPGLHPMSALPMKPGSHVQTIVLNGSESTTEQTA